MASRYVLISAMPVLRPYSYFFLSKQGNFSIIIMDTHPSCKPAIPDTMRAVQAETKEIHFRLPSAAPLHCPTVLPRARSVLPPCSLFRPGRAIQDPKFGVYIIYIYSLWVIDPPLSFFAWCDSWEEDVTRILLPWEEGKLCKTVKAEHGLE